MKVFTVGTFDIPHIGHYKLFERASGLGDLTVGLNTDAYVKEYKGKYPVFKYNERYETLQLCPFINKIIPNNQDDLMPMLTEHKPDILVVGSDWVGKYYDQIKVTQRQLEDMGILFLYLPYTKIISTSEIKRRLNETS
jgi:glycerol-3-phosphate cytidylyltransferase